MVSTLVGSSETVQDLLQAKFETLTRAERQLANSLLENYPVSGLASITSVAQSANVSTPTVVRMAKKLGYEGFGEFQGALRRELSARISDPIRKRDSWASDAPDSHILNRFAEAVMANLGQTLARIDPATFDRVAEMLCETERHIYVAGGRITRSLAQYFFNHMQVMRPNVTQLGTAPGVWPHYLLDMKPGDTLILFDIRRYENALLRLAELADKRGAAIVLVTDQWGSPITKFAEFKFNCRIDVPSAWDSSVAILLILETLITAVQELTWDETKDRMQELEEIFDKTGLFRRFV